MSHGVRYRVHRKLARGGMAEIFLASQISLEGFEKPVVLKRILPALASDPGFVRMLVDEAHIVSSLNHTNLVQVLDLWRADDQFFLVLEFVDGWSLEQVRVRARKARLKLPLHLALSITSGLCRALHYVHRRTRNGKPLGIVHRDVTPQNVLLSREGDVKLADFGIAKAVGRREKSATGVIKGKFAYMSPEQSIGAELDARSDLFSVGTLLYVLTTGQKAFTGKTDLDVLMQVRRARHQKPSAHVRDFNPDVERFIERALRADRSRRWQTAEQMADRLDNILVKLGQPSGPAALKRWLAALTVRDGVLAPGDLRELPLEPSTSIWEDDDEEIATTRERATSMQQSLSGNDALTAAVSQDDAAATTWMKTAIRSDEATQALSELDLVLASGIDGGAAPGAAAGDAGTATVHLQMSDLQEHTPDVDRSSGAEAAEKFVDADFARPSSARVPAGSASAIEPTVQTTGETTSAPLPLPLALDTRRSRTSRLARIARALRRTAILAVLLSMLLGGGVYVARPFLPEWIASARFMKWLDRLRERLPRSLDFLGERSSLAPAEGCTAACRSIAHDLEPDVAG